MSEKEFSPEVKKAVWKIVLYVVTVLASLFGGNQLANNGIDLIPKIEKHVEK